MKERVTTNARWTRRIALVALLSAVYLITLAALAPASVVWRLAEPRLALPFELTLGAVSGSIWNGQAGTVRVNDQPLGALGWQWQPGALMSGRLGLKLRWQMDTDRVDAEVRLGRSSADVARLHGGLAASRLQAWLDLPLLLDGRVDLDIAHIAWNGRAGVHAAEGALLWSEAAAGLPRPVPLGHYRAGLEPEDGGLTARVDSDPDSMLAVRGVAGWSPPGDHRVDFEMRIRTEAQSMLKPTLDLLAQPQADGSHRLRLDSREPG